MILHKSEVPTSPKTLRTMHSNAFSLQMSLFGGRVLRHILQHPALLPHGHEGKITYPSSCEKQPRFTSGAPTFPQKATQGSESAGLIWNHFMALKPSTFTQPRLKTYPFRVLLHAVFAMKWLNKFKSLIFKWMFPDLYRITIIQKYLYKERSIESPKGLFCSP